jgi:hypothetical protein
MSQLIVIGICGQARTGKDTAAAAVSLLRGCHRIALADGVREAFAGLSGPTAEFHKELNATHNFRRALQTLGTEARNAANAPGLWVHLALTKIYYASRIHPNPRHRFVIPDLRFRLEAAMLIHQVAQWRGRFAVLGLERTGEVIPEAGHSSETEVASVPRLETYQNDGTIGELIEAACRFFDRVSAGGVRE